MRALNDEEQEHRKRKVLQFVIHEYIRTGKPVGSSIVASTGRLGLSSATIRNVLAELEKEDKITHPHTSAGRIPTDKGYRMYVDSLIDLQRLAVQEETRIQNEYEKRIREIEDLLSQTSSILSSLSHYTGFVMVPKLEQNVFSKLELVPISGHRVLVAMITESGLAKHFIINVPSEIPRERLQSIARFLNQNFKGCTLQEIQSRMAEKLDYAQQEYREMLSLAKEIGQEIKKFSSGEIFLEGASNILSLPDFSKADDFHNLFRIIEEKQLLTNILEEDLVLGWDQEENETDQQLSSSETKGSAESKKLKHLSGKKLSKNIVIEGKRGKSTRVHVRIGSENTVKALQNLSVVSSTYQLPDRTVGVLGILGPKRMEYSKMISLVDYISRTVNRFLKDFDNE